MPQSNTLRLSCTGLLLAVLCQPAIAQDDLADVRAKNRILTPDTLQYYLIGTAGKVGAPERGYKLLIVMPGGAGGHGWHGDVFNNIRQGIEWLEGQVEK
ncbi:MAG: hypothetical protein WD738_13670 [Pirellulales bacterium]